MESAWGGGVYLRHLFSKRVWYTNVFIAFLDFSQKYMDFYVSKGENSAKEGENSEVYDFLLGERGQMQKDEGRMKHAERMGETKVKDEMFHRIRLIINRL